MQQCRGAEEPFNGVRSAFLHIILQNYAAGIIVFAEHFTDEHSKEANDIEI
jgi:hypothetical protein